MMACNNNATKGVMPMEKSQREIVVGDKTRTYGINHAVSRGGSKSPGPGTKNGGSLV